MRLFKSPTAGRSYSAGAATAYAALRNAEDINKYTIDVVFIDPTITTTGIDAFEANVRDFRQKFAGARCLRTSGMDAHHDLFRYSWEIRKGSQVLVQGIDIVRLHPTQRVQHVFGFFGPLPALG